jgi:hypothetical protein
VSIEEPATPDLGGLRTSLGLPPVGVRLDRGQSLRMLAALDSDTESIPDHAWTWARRVLGVHARTA